MTRTIVVHSHRGGTGKSSVLANLALLLAAEGRRVGVVDTDIQSPTLDLLFRLGPGASLTDYLLGRCEIETTAQQIGAVSGQGGLYVVPARTGTAALREIMAGGYDVGLLPEGFDRLAAHYALDVLLLDTHAGLNNESVTAMASADVLMIMARADRIDLSGVEETIALAGRLTCRRNLVLSMAPEGIDREAARRRSEAVYGAPLAGILPYSPEMAALYGERIFAEAHPDHPLVGEFRTIISALDARDEVSRA
ncbi:MinD/ParA family ATP-binding protein [Streptomyces nojiriensis]|uniref:CDP-3, 6-dideoxy-D-glycero-L-glycero-4-hexulose-4-reductase n=1 Tax=Streptomyces nojiriensis TaxID=66374 RepID=A0ABQ3SRK2_9ACTN|nr:MinD/ParA family protein [Streptomyces nojiriensis]QTI44336.1 Tyrosine-protein kinase YwqD [Streptomyces nojiriensis]GGS06671.1 CDP-3, 6-dideoxy-D-glycero-L-glycero-4-hexulose-4-reductase [Streptomyces nojiriensis]GHI70779.1 CDP-3, 6-dideoxy-D-glycero-L-glycero-4-hexulose-4-reductase [Streptomyces nojiriensis]